MYIYIYACIYIYSVCVIEREREGGGEIKSICIVYSRRKVHVCMISVKMIKSEVIIINK